MATVYQLLCPEEAEVPSSTFARFIRIDGTAFALPLLTYSPTADEAAFWKLDAINYGSGNLTVDIFWYADTASSGNIVWGAAIAAITANTDTQDIETDTLATENTVTDSHLGTTGQRLHKATITVSNLDSLASGDAVWIRIRRLGSNGSDTMAGDAYLERAIVSYSDT